MARCALISAAIVILSLISQATSAMAAPASESVLPQTTKGFLSVASVDDLKKRWDETQLGQLAKDPLMEPFAEDLRKQLRSRLDKARANLGVTLDDLKGVPAGELCLAVIQPNNDEKRHATVLMVDVTGRDKEVSQLLEKVAKTMAAKGATKASETLQSITVTSYTLPKLRGETVSHRAFYFIHDNRLVATDDDSTAKGLLANLVAPAAKSLATLPAFQATMKRCEQAPDVVPTQVRWFLEPFGYAQAMRAIAGGRKKRGTDMLKVFTKQGFTAVQGVGGHIAFSAAGKEILHKTFVFAPAVNKAGPKYKLAMRMMDFPKSARLAPQDWVLQDASVYLTFNWKMRDAFNFLGSLVDEVAGAPVFEDVLASLEKDPSGPRINVRKGFIDQLGERVTFFTGCRLPVTPQSERWLFAIELTNPAVVAKTLDKVMENDADAKKKLLGKQVIWEIVEQREPEPSKKPKVAVPKLGTTKTDDEDEDEDKPAINPLFKHASMTVIYGHLMVASHLDYLVEVLKRAGKEPSLAKSADYQLVSDTLAKIGGGNNSLRYFVRSDRSLHPTYELLRQGKMPESETISGTLLNKLLGAEEDGAVRKPQVDGKKLPEFEKVRRYFGPRGSFADAEDDGWFLTGCMLTKPVAAPAAAVPPAATPAVPKPTASAPAAPASKPPERPGL